jgi:hypothetical protein
MAKLATYELANLAMWSFDFDQASSLFNSVIEQSSERTDLLATWGAMEGSLIMNEARARSWSQMDQDGGLTEILKSHVKSPVAGLIEEPERVRRFESFISAKEKEILRGLQKQKSRLRDKRLRNVYGDKSGGSPGLLKISVQAKDAKGNLNKTYLKLPLL